MNKSQIYKCESHGPYFLISHFGAWLLFSDALLRVSWKTTLMRLLHFEHIKHYL